MMVRLKIVGNDLRVAGFVPFGPIKTYRERLERPQSRFVGVRNDGAGIQTSTQKHAERHFAHQANAHTLRQERVQLFHNFSYWPRRSVALLKVQMPVFAGSDRTVLIGEPVRRW